MKTFKNYALAEAGFVILAGALVCLDSHVGYAAQTTVQDVRVVNTSALPVPVTAPQPLQTIVQNPVQVTASQPLATAVLGPFPLPVRELDNPGRQAFQAQVSATIAANSFSGFDSSFIVPAGKRFVIEHVSALGVITPPDQLLLVAIDVTVNSSPIPTISHLLAPQNRGQVNPQQTSHYWVASEQTRLYADPGTTISVSGQRNDDAVEGTVSVRLSGHLVDVT
jgi:hypothetical protein